MNDTVKIERLITDVLRSIDNAKRANATDLDEYVQETDAYRRSRILTRMLERETRIAALQDTLRSIQD